MLAIQTVTVTGIDHDLKVLFVGLLQRIDQAHGMLHVHVIVEDAMNNEQAAVQVGAGAPTNKPGSEAASNKNWDPPGFAPTNVGLAPKCR